MPEYIYMEYSTDLFTAAPINNNNIVIKQKNEDNRLLKQAIWIYFLLVIFEGALRKWFLPGLATPLLIIRDPIAVWLIYKSWKQGLIPNTFYLTGIVIIGVIGTYTAIFIGHGNVIVALFGARIFLLHYPLIFIIGRIFDREDILKMGKVTLYMAIPMVILIYLQFKSPQSAWVNRGVGGDLAGAGFAGSGDFFRPPGTFSFTNGTALYFGLLASFVFYYWLTSIKISKWFLIAVTIALLIAVPISISRTLFFEVALSLTFTVIATLRKPEYLSRIVLAIIVGAIVLAILSQTGFFKIATGAFTDRFDVANEQEGGLVKGVIGDRFFGGLISSLLDSNKQPFFGYGLGMGTNVGSQLLSGKLVFLISELAWGQLVGELGPVMGLIVIFIRVGLTLKIAIASYKNMINGDFLPWLLLSFGFLIILQSGWSQPTSLGFCIVIGGLLLASLKSEKQTSHLII